MTNKETKQTKKTETKGLYNTIPSKDMTKGLITTRKDLSYWEKQDLKRKKGIKHFRRGILRLLHEDTGQSIASKPVLRHLYLKIAGFKLMPKKIITIKDLKKAWGRK